MLPIPSSHCRKIARPPNSEVVEVSLVLPTQRMEALLDLSRRRHQSVGQLLRHLIDQALADDEEPGW